MGKRRCTNCKILITKHIGPTGRKKCIYEAQDPDLLAQVNMQLEVLKVRHQVDPGSVPEDTIFDGRSGQQSVECEEESDLEYERRLKAEQRVSRNVAGQASGLVDGGRLSQGKPSQSNSQYAGLYVNVDGKFVKAENVNDRTVVQNVANGGSTAMGAPVHVSQLQSQLASQSQSLNVAPQGSSWYSFPDTGRQLYQRVPNVSQVGQYNPGQVAWNGVNPGQVAWNTMDRYSVPNNAGIGATSNMTNPLRALGATGAMATGALATGALVTGALANSQYSQYVNPDNRSWNVMYPSWNVGGPLPGQVAWGNNDGQMYISGHPGARLWEVPRPSGVPMVAGARTSQRGLANNVGAGTFNSNDGTTGDVEDYQDLQDFQTGSRDQDHSTGGASGRPGARGKAKLDRNKQKQPSQQGISTCKTGASSARVRIQGQPQQQPVLVSCSTQDGAGAEALGNKVTVDINYLKSLEDSISRLSVQNNMCSMPNDFVRGPGAMLPPPLQWGPQSNDFNILHEMNMNQQYVRPIVPGLRQVTDDMPVFGLCEVEGVQDKVLLSTLKGEFCDLSNYLPNMSLPCLESNEMSLVSDSRGNVQYKMKRQKRQVKSFSSWLEAWGNYENLMGSFHGMHVLRELAKYRALIIDYETKYMWYSIQTFDVAHRAKKSGRSVVFCEIDQNLWNQFFDSSALKQGPKCSHCKSMKHTTAVVSASVTPVGAHT